MTKQAEKPEKAGGMTPFQPFDWFAGVNNLSMEAFSEASRAYVNGMAAVNGEVFRFLSQRMRRDMETGQSMARCDDWSKAAALQQDWVRAAMEDYMAESSRLMELTSKATMESWKPLYEGATRTARELREESESAAKKAA